MIRERDVINCLPLLAAILGNQYGVKVKVGGHAAFCKGKEICLPSLPPEGDETLLPLVRGFIDHEAGHIRHTNSAVVQRANMSPVTKHMWNSIEDWRVEHLMAARYPGCREHFDWLIEHYILQNNSEEVTGEHSPVIHAINYVLSVIRSWDVPSFQRKREQIREKIDDILPGLADELDAVLGRVQKKCPDTQAAIGYAQELAECLRRWKLSDMAANSSNQNTPSANMKGASQCSKREGGQSVNGSANASHDKSGGSCDDGGNGGCNDLRDKSGQASHSGCACKSEGQSSNSQGKSEDGKQDIQEESEATSGIEQSLEDLFNLSEADVPETLGKLIASALEQWSVQNCSSATVRIASIGKKPLEPLEDDEISAAMRSSAALRHRLQGLLQAQSQKRIAIGRRGALDTGILYRLSVGNPRLFRKECSHPTVQTAVHILIDTSGSMHDDMCLTRQAAYAVAKSLETIRGINLAVTGFPCVGWAEGVYPLVQHGCRVTNNFGVRSGGGTPLAEALWWVFQKLWFQKEERKLILVLTDGAPGDDEAALDAIARIEAFGVETYGIGIRYESVRRFFRHNCVINDIGELASAMFGMLQGALLGGSHGRR